MPLEDLTGIKFINALVNTNPDGAVDFLNTADDHIRGIKNVLLQSFPAITGAVTADQSELNLLDGALASTAEINYLQGVTSAIQPQLNLKAPLASPTFTGTVNAGAINGTTITASVDFVLSSDRKIKENIKDIDRPLQRLGEINGVFYNLKEGDKKRKAGVIAQEVFQALPEAVSRNEKDVMQVSYNMIVGLLVEAVNELNDKVDMLEMELEAKS